MAKKTVATLQTGGGKQHSKVIKMVRSTKSGAYSFREEIVHNDEIDNWFNKKD
jgi:hypothetical protein